jgi:acetyl-CoA carboxylase biotin carboxyl carrier protein
LELKDIKRLIDLMKKNDLTELRVEKEDCKIALKRGFETVVAAPAPQAFVAAPVVAPQLPPAASSAPAAAPAPLAEGKEVVSPMVGTFYRAASPEAASFVDVGSQVTPDTVVCIIEAMKVMNEIKAEVAGTVVEVLAENGKPVQFGQALFRVK